MSAETQPEELTPAELQTLRGRLADLVVELGTQLRLNADGANPIELDQTAVGRLSRMDSIQQQAMAKAARRNLEVRLSQCHAALAACERGVYGLCRECEEPIGLPRLSANPEAPFCLTCQQGSDER
jgi:DnaK suppressor protein